MIQKTSACATVTCNSGCGPLPAGDPGQCSAMCFRPPACKPPSRSTAYGRQMAVVRKLSATRVRPGEALRGSSGTGWPGHKARAPKSPSPRPGAACRTGDSQPPRQMAEPLWVEFTLTRSRRGPGQGASLHSGCRGPQGERWTISACTTSDLGKLTSDNVDFLRTLGVGTQS